MIVGVCGLGWTGSGAVKDLLTEYDEVFNLAGTGNDFEFSYVYRTDGILDLRYHLFDGICREMSSNDALNRFWDSVTESCGFHSRIQRLTNGQYLTLSKEYLESISQITWDYFRLRSYTNGGKLRQLKGRILYKIQREVDKRSSKFVSVFPKTTCYYSNSPEDFDIKSKKYISKIINSVSEQAKEHRFILLDQPFAGDFPEKSFPYFEDPYAIVVDRDPRDLYIMMKKVSFSQGHLTDDVNRFIIFFKNIRKNIQDSNSRVLRIKFENLVYNYEETKQNIENFLGIEKHSRKYMYFNPNISVNNTQIYLRYPEEKKNIERIEEELSDYLFDFPSQQLDLSHKVF